MSVLLTASLSAALPLSAASHVDVVKRRTENRAESFGNLELQPLASPGRLLLQERVWLKTSYQILVASSREKLDRKPRRYLLG